MKKWGHIIKITVLVGIALFIVFIANILISTGVFRTIENKFEGKIIKKIALPGAEDITVSLVDSFALISSTNRKQYPPKEDERGGLYLMDLISGDYNTIPLTSEFPEAFAPHGISMIKTGSATTVMAVNHTQSGHSIEVFTLHDKQLTSERSLTHNSMVSPNDIVLVGENRFYFTNDHKYTHGIGRLFEDYAGLSLSNVVYFDGENYQEVANGIAYANGINVDTKRNLLYVASPRKFLVKIYSMNNNGTLNFIEDIPCGTGVDNIELDTNGKLWIGGHPNLLRFAAYAKGKKETSPSEIITIDYHGLNDYIIEQIYLDDGSGMSSSSVAAPFGELIITGNVKDDHFLILKKGR